MKYRNLSDLTPLEGNPRAIKKHQFEKLLQSLKDNLDYFEARPIILSNRTGELVIIAGNQRYHAAKELGYKEVPTFLMEGLTEEREKEIIIRDNVSNGEWDWEQLANSWEVEELQEWGVEGFPFDGIDEDGEMNMPSGWMLTVKSNDVKELEAIEKDLISKGLDVKLKEK